MARYPNTIVFRRDKMILSRTAIVLFIALLLMPAILYAGPGDSVLRNKPLPLNGIMMNAENISREFTDLDRLLEKQGFNIEHSGNEFTPEYFEKMNTTDSGGYYKNLAKNVFAETEATGNFVEVLNPEDINKLPVGLKKRIGNTEITIAVSSAVFTKDYASLTVFCRIKIPQAPYMIFFGVEGLQLSRNGGLRVVNGITPKLVLLGDVYIPINGGNAALILQGGFNIKTGEAEDKTYVSMTCNGFEEMRMKAAVEFPRTMLIPVDRVTGDTLPGRVRGSFTLRVRNWNDIYTGIDTLPNFEIAGLKGFVFNIQGAKIDLSDSYTDSTCFPSGYVQRHIGPIDVNLWRGVFVKNLEVFLPGAFKDRNTNTRVSFGVNNLIIDNNGVTGLFRGDNVLPLSKGSASGWKFSVDSVRLNIEANRLTRAGFGGRIGLPVNKASDTDTANKQKYLQYAAVVTASGDYQCRVTTLDSLEFGLWKARILLKPNSYIQLTGNGRMLKPEAMLNGALSVQTKSYNDESEVARKNNVADIKGVQFTGLHLKTDAPRFSIQSFSYDGDIRVANFPAFIDSISLQTTGTNEMSLAFNVNLTLQDEVFKGKTRLNIVSQFEEGGGLGSWRFKKLKIEEIEINAIVRNAFQLDGRVRFMDNDPVYGDGFSSGIHVKFLNGWKAELTAKVMFGKVNDYRYWYFDGKADFGTVGIPAGIINLKGFGGGAYYRMRKNDFAPAFTDGTGITYKPDSTAGLGVKALLMFTAGTPGPKPPISGEGSFEIAFNNNGGGMAYIGLFGYMEVMTTIPGLDRIGDSLVKKFQRVYERLDALKVAGMDSTQLNNLKLFQPTVAASKVYVPARQPGTADNVAAFAGIQYDFNQQSLHATCDIYIKAAAGMITGASSGNRAGWMVFHVEPGKWYLHIGNPTDQIGLKIGIGPVTVSTGAYFMVGHEIPPFPQPPSNVIQILQQSGLSYSNQMSMGDISNGKGIAFGAKVQLNTGDLRFLIFYANFAAGVGFDVMIKNLGDTRCDGNRIGIDGWYAFGQAYAYLQGELGVRVKIGPIKKRIPIIKGGAAALLQARLPNPTWVGGYLGFHVNILGGLIKGKFKFKFSFGKECTLVQDVDESAEFDAFNVVSSVTPADSSQQVTVFTEPRVYFALKPTVGAVEGQTMEYLDDVQNIHYIRARLDYARVMAGNDTVAVTHIYTPSVGELRLKHDRAFDFNTEYKIKVRVIFEEYKNNSWTIITEDGQVADQKREYTFRTGNGADSVIDVNAIDYMYPYINQRFFYKNESATGYIKLLYNYSSLFNNYSTWKAVFSIPNQEPLASSTVTFPLADRLEFAIPPSLAPNTTYQVEITGTGLVGNYLTDSVRTVLRFKFTTSRYNTFAEKMSNIQMTQPVVGRVSSDVIDLQAATTHYEGFAKEELVGGRYTNNQPSVRTEAIMDDYYYTNVIRPLVYPNYADTVNGPFYQDVAELGRPVLPWGRIPSKAIRVAPFYLSMLQSGNYNESINTRLPFIYDLPRLYNFDFRTFRAGAVEFLFNQLLGSSDPRGNQIGIDYNAILTGQSEYGDPQDLADLMQACNKGMCQTLNNIITKPFPFINQGAYKIQLQYYLPGNTAGTSNIFTFQNPIE